MKKNDKKRSRESHDGMWMQLAISLIMLVMGLVLSALVTIIVLLGRK